MQDRSFSRGFRRVCSFGGALVLGACGEYVTDQGMSVARVEVAASAVSLVLGDSVRLSAVAYASGGHVITSTKVRIAWVSDAPGIAEANVASGWVVARGVGQTIVRATSRGKTDSVRVLVTARAP
jgi:hypothetical protein